MELEHKDYIYVSLQLLLFVAYIFNVEMIAIVNNNNITVIGVPILVIGVLTAVIALLQLNSNLSPFPTPKPNTTLIKNGVFKYIRHPIYSGIILITFGYGVYQDSLYKIIISILLFALFYFKSSYEEKRLQITFSDYTLYQKRSGRFFPKF